MKPPSPRDGMQGARWGAAVRIMHGALGRERGSIRAWTLAHAFVSGAVSLLPRVLALAKGRPIVKTRARSCRARLPIFPQASRAAGRCRQESLGHKLDQLPVPLSEKARWSSQLHWVSDVSKQKANLLHGSRVGVRQADTCARLHSCSKKTSSSARFANSSGAGAESIRRSDW